MLSPPPWLVADEHLASAARKPFCAAGGARDAKCAHYRSPKGPADCLFSARADYAPLRSPEAAVEGLVVVDAQSRTSASDLQVVVVSSVSPTHVLVLLSSGAGEGLIIGFDARSLLFHFVSAVAHGSDTTASAARVWTVALSLQRELDVLTVTGAARRAFLRDRIAPGLLLVPRDARCLPVCTDPQVARELRRAGDAAVHSCTHLRGGVTLLVTDRAVATLSRAGAIAGRVAFCDLTGVVWTARPADKTPKPGGPAAGEGLDTVLRLLVRAAAAPSSPGPDAAVAGGGKGGPSFFAALLLGKGKEKAGEKAVGKGKEKGDEKATGKRKEKEGEKTAGKGGGGGRGCAPSDELIFASEREAAAAVVALRECFLADQCASLAVDSASVAVAEALPSSLHSHALASLFPYAPAAGPAPGKGACLTAIYSWCRLTLSRHLSRLLASFSQLPADRRPLAARCLALACCAEGTVANLLTAAAAFELEVTGSFEGLFFASEPAEASFASQVILAVCGGSLGEWAELAVAPLLGDLAACAGEGGEGEGVCQPLPAEKHAEYFAEVLRVVSVSDRDQTVPVEVRLAAAAILLNSGLAGVNGCGAIARLVLRHGVAAAIQRVSRRSSDPPGAVLREARNLADYVASRAALHFPPGTPRADLPGEAAATAETMLYLGSTRGLPGASFSAPAPPRLRRAAAAGAFLPRHAVEADGPFALLSPLVAFVQNHAFELLLGSWDSVDDVAEELDSSKRVVQDLRNSM
eukprot:gene17102-26235_t